MRRVVVGLAILLAVSLAVNLYQWRRRPSAPFPPARDAASARSSVSVPATPPPAATSAPGAGGIVAKTCAAQLAALGTKLATVEAELDKSLRPHERFERSGPAPSREPAIREKLTKLFADAPTGWTWQVECRGDACKLEVIERERGTNYDWMAKVQSGALAGIVDGMMFRAGTPSQDPVSKEPLFSEEAYLALTDVGSVSGMEILQRILAAFRDDPQRAACAQGAPEGFLSLQLELDPATRRVEVAAGGTLALTPVGTCLRGVLDAAIAREPVPEGVRSAVVYASVELPLDQ